MTWREANLALQHEAEEKLGGPMRQAATERRALEDAAFDALPKPVG